MATFAHASAKISERAAVDVSSRGTNTYIDEGAVIDDFVKIKHVGGSGDVRIGRHSMVNSGCVIYSGNGVTIGEGVLIGPNCCLTSVNHCFKDRDRPIRLQGFMLSRGGIIIEDDVWIGANVTILDGACIRRGSVVGANSLVNGEIPAYSICFGVPAKVKSTRG